MKQVRKMKAGRSIEVYIILCPRGSHVATVQAHYSDAGVVRVDTFDFCDTTQPVYNGVAGGGGYDKFASALSGAIIDGHTMKDDGSSAFNKLRSLGYKIIQGI